MLSLLLSMISAFMQVSESRQVGGMGYPKAKNDSISINRNYPASTVPNIHACSIVDITDCCQWIWGPHWQEVLAKLFVGSGSAMANYVKRFRRKRGEAPLQETYLMEYYTDASKFRVPMEADYTREIPYNGVNQRPALDFTCVCTLHPNSIWLFVANEAQYYKDVRETQMYRTYCEVGETPKAIDRSSLREYGRMDLGTGRSSYKTTSGFCKRAKKDGDRPNEPFSDEEKRSWAQSVKEIVESRQQEKQHKADIGSTSESNSAASTSEHDGHHKKRKTSDESRMIVLSGSTRCISVPTPLMVSSLEPATGSTADHDVNLNTAEHTAIVATVTATAVQEAALLDLAASHQFYDPEDWNKLLNEPISSSDIADIPQIPESYIYSSATQPLTLYASAPNQELQGLPQTRQLAALGPTHYLDQQAIVAVSDIELTNVPRSSSIRPETISACLASSIDVPDLTMELRRAVAAIEGQKYWSLPPP